MNPDMKPILVELKTIALKLFVCPRGNCCSDVCRNREPRSGDYCRWEHLAAARGPNKNVHFGLRTKCLDILYRIKYNIYIRFNSIRDAV